MSLSDYAGANGFLGTASDADIAALHKALETGYAVGLDNRGSGGSNLRVESLEQSLKVMTFSDKHLKFWKKAVKSAAYSTVKVQPASLLRHLGQGGWIREAELQSTDSIYKRQHMLIKYLGTVREVSHQSTLVNPAHGDVIALENQNGILWLLYRDRERALPRRLLAAPQRPRRAVRQPRSADRSRWSTTCRATRSTRPPRRPRTRSSSSSACRPTSSSARAPTPTSCNFYGRDGSAAPYPQNGKVGLGPVGADLGGRIELNPPCSCVPARPRGARRQPRRRRRSRWVRLPAPGAAASPVATVVPPGTTRGDFGKS